MLKKVKYYAKLFVTVIRRRREVVSILEAHLKKSRKGGKFVRKFGYLPEGLEFNDLDILRLSRSSKIGNGNKLTISRTKFPTKSCESLISLGNNCWTGKNVEVNILTGTQVIIKDYSTIQDNCKLIGDVTVEKYCLIAPNVFMSSGQHHIAKNDSNIIRNQDEQYLTNEELISHHSQPIHIEEDCWIGFSSYLKAGVYVGRGAVLGANAVVTKDVMPYTIIGGANKIIGNRCEFDPPTAISATTMNDRLYFYRGFCHKNAEAKQIEGHMLLGARVGVLVLKRGGVERLKISGKLISSNYAPEGILSVVENGTLLYTAMPEIDQDGCFHMVLSGNKCDETTPPDNDLVSRMETMANVFHVSFIPGPNTNSVDNTPMIAISHFEEILSQNLIT